VIETEYYLIDLPKIMNKSKEMKKIGRLEDINILLATNNRAMDEESYKKLINSYISESKIKIENNFDREAFEALRFAHNQGLA
jgi:predicted nucleotidyltransferase